MSRTTLLILVAAVVLMGGALAIAQRDASGPAVSSGEGTRVDAPGTTVESDNEKIRIQAPGVDITVPKRNDED